MNPEWKNYTHDLYRYRDNLENVSGEWKLQNETQRSETDDGAENMWAPVALLSVVLFLYNIGLGSVPYVLISELFAINVSIIRYTDHFMIQLFLCDPSST